MGNEWRFSYERKMPLGPTTSCSITLCIIFFVGTAICGDMLRIDCGSKTSYYDKDESYWDVDSRYITIGENAPVSSNNYNTWSQLNTLRVFKENNINRYLLPTSSGQRYMIRAAFYHGNYDGSSNPPAFDVEFQGSPWATVVTSITEPKYLELVFTSTGKNVSVCLSKPHDENQFSFINILELWGLDDDMYDGMTRDRGWLGIYRYDYGANGSTIGYPQDEYNRIWETMPTLPPDLEPVNSDSTYIYDSGANHVPDSIILNGIESSNPSTSINLSFPVNQTNALNYVATYFTEVRSLDENETRSFDVYVNDKFVSTINPREYYTSSAWTFTQSNQTLNVQLRPRNDSTLPPLISAIEIYTATISFGNSSNNDLPGIPKSGTSINIKWNWKAKLALGLTLTICFTVYIIYQKEVIIAVIRTRILRIRIDRVIVEENEIRSTSNSIAKQ